MVDAAGVERMASQQPATSKPRAAEGAVHLKRFECIGRTRGIEPAASWPPLGDHAVQPDDAAQQPRNRPYAPGAQRQDWQDRAQRRTCSAIPVWRSLNGTDSVRWRATTTTS